MRNIILRILVIASFQIAFVNFAVGCIDSLRNDRGDLIIRAQLKKPGVDYTRNEILFKTLPGTLILPKGRVEANLNECIVDRDLLMTLIRANVYRIRKLIPNAIPGDTLYRLNDSTVVRIPDFLNNFKGFLTTGTAVYDAIDILCAENNILWAEPNAIVKFYTEPNDSYYHDYQWNLKPSGYGINCETAWGVTTGSNGIKIGVIGTGIDASHPDLANKVVGGYNYCYGNNQWGDDGHNNGHETSVAGIIGARTNNSIGMAGIAGGWGNGNNVGPALYSLRITDGGGPGVLDVLINAIYGACHTFDCDILNMSLGIGTYSDALLEVIKMAQSEKRILVAAAGNEGYLLSNPINPHNVYPAQFEDATMIVVGSYGQNGNRCRTEFGNCCSDGSCYSSNYGYPLDFIAPGISIPSISPNSGYNLNFWGTSAACPQATGVIALALSRIPDLWSEDINWIFKKAAVDAGPVGFDDDFGWGRLNAGNLFSILLPANVDHGKINHFSEQMGGYHEIELYYEAQMKFYGVDGLSHSTMYQAECWKAIYYVAYPADFEMCMGVWGNRYAIPGVDESTPWSAANPNYTTGFCEVVPGSDTKEGCSLAGYFFHVNIGNEWRWFPCDPADCPTYLNYSVWGIIKDGTPNRPGGEKLDSQQRNMLTANCYPNPSNAGFNILYDLNNDSYIEITIFDIMGRTIKTLFKGQRTEGQYSINWDGKDNSGINISTGIYFYHISSAFGSKIGRIVLVK